MVSRDSSRKDIYQKLKKKGMCQQDKERGRNKEQRRKCRWKKII
jgi:hypothetical protein